MPWDIAKNFSKVTVSTGYDAVAVSVVLSAGHGLKLPTAPFNATWYNSTDYSDPSDDPNVEIVRVTAIFTDTLTITRAQEGTTATTKNTASKTYKMIAGLTAKVINSDLLSLTTPARSSRMNFVFPDNTINAATDIQGELWHCLSAMWYELDASGNLVQRNNSTFGTNFFYTAANAAIVRKNSTLAFVNVSSGTAVNVNALTASNAKRKDFVSTLVSFCKTNDFDGVDLDLETFQTGSMTVAQYDNFRILLAELGEALHKEGFYLSIEVPPIWNTAANSESGTGDVWDTANSQGYYRLKYEDLNNLPVDRVVIMAYDFQYDYSAGASNQPLKWLQEILEFARSKINENKIQIIAGIPAAGYTGATNSYSITGATYTVISAISGFAGATRDAASGELNFRSSFAALTATAALLTGATSLTLTAGFPYATGSYEITFSNGDLRAVNCTNAGTSVTWTPGLSSGATTALQLNQSNWISDDTAIGLKIAQAESQGIYHYALWHVGNNKYGGRTATNLQPGNKFLNDPLKPMPHLAYDRTVLVTPVAGVAAPSVFGIAITATGTNTLANVATTNLHNWKRRTEYLVTVAATTAVAGFRSTAGNYGIGNAAGTGGFNFICEFGPATGVATTTHRLFVGMGPTAAPTDVEPSSILNIIGVGYDAADANFQIMHNDGTGTATKVNLGASFPVPTVDRTEVYRLQLFAEPNASLVTYIFENLTTGASAK